MKLTGFDDVYKTISEHETVFIKQTIKVIKVAAIIFVSITLLVGIGVSL